MWIVTFPLVMLSAFSIIITFPSAAIFWTVTGDGDKSWEIAFSVFTWAVDLPYKICGV